MRGWRHVLFAPLCEDGEQFVVSAQAMLASPAQLARLAIHDAGLRSALEQSVARYGPCEDKEEGGGDSAGGKGLDSLCGYAVLADVGDLCPSCSVPEGGGATLVTDGDSEAGEVEVAHFESRAGALKGPAVLRLDLHSVCWGGWRAPRGECFVRLLVEDRQGEEISRHPSVLLLEL
jgi:hypothetical protein